MRPLAVAPEVGELLRLPTPGVYARAAEGRLPGVRRIGRAVRFRMDVIEQWVEAGCPERDHWPAAWHPVQLGDERLADFDSENAKGALAGAQRDARRNVREPGHHVTP